jgi:hypothetical protein
MAGESGEEVRPGQWGLVAIAWLAVSIPLLWGVWMTIKRAAALFG